MAKRPTFDSSVVQTDHSAYKSAQRSAYRETIHAAEFCAIHAALGAAKYQCPDRKTNSAAFNAADHTAERLTFCSTDVCS